ncbi:MAG: AMP-binding protein [Cytophagales bacterium]
MSLPDLRKNPSKTEQIISAEEMRNYFSLKDKLPAEVFDVIRDWKEGRPFFKFKTSGSTGAPKDLEISRERILKSAQKSIKFLNLHSGLTALLALKLDYIAGFMVLIRALEAGMDLHYFPPSSDPFEKLNPHKNYFAALVPLQVHSLLHKKYDLKNFHSILIGGAALNYDLKKKLETLHYPVYESYGMTETVSHIALKKLNQKDKSDRFKILENVEIDIDERSCIKIKADVTNNCWIKTNDIVEIHSKYEFSLLGRIDDVINSGGIKIYPLQLEELIQEKADGLLEHKEFVISSKPDELLGEKAVLVIEGKSPYDEYVDELLDSLTGIQRYLIPKEIVFLNKLPRTNSGKIQRKGVINALA